MIFETTADQITRLDPSQLVNLMRRLIHAEAVKTEIPLYNAHIPAQITVADGGEDGRIKCAWSSRTGNTNFFPSNFVIFQAKATILSESKVRKEIFKKGTGTKKKPAQPNEAISSLLLQNGSYVLFTNQALVAQRITTFKNTIIEAIKETGEDPNKLNAIEIYDANKISTWVNSHQAISLWLNQVLREKDYSNFLSYEHWGDVFSATSLPWVEDEEPRFKVTGGSPYPSEDEENIYSFSKARELIISHLSEPQAVLRVSGSSGIGKSRFVHQLFQKDDLGSKFCVSSLIYCNYCDVKEKAMQLANSIAQTSSDVILIVDECGDEAHRRLSEVSTAMNAKLRIVTIETETVIQPDQRTMLVAVQKLSAKCINQLYPDLNLDYHKDFIDGSPSMAVLVGTAIKEKGNPITKVNELVERMIWGNRPPHLPALRSLEVLCLFGFLGCDKDKFAEMQALAMPLAEVSPETMYRYLIEFIPRGLVEQLGDYLKAKPLPLSLCLAEQALRMMAPTMRSFLCANISHDLLSRLLKQIKWLHYSKSAQDISNTLLSDSFLGNFKEITEGFGAIALMYLVELTPELALSTLQRVFNNVSHDDLKTLTHCRRNIVWTLEKLCFPREYFMPASKLLLRLAAAENGPSFGNNATDIFKRLFHLELSGTEAEPTLRLAILDEILNSQHTPTQEIGMLALDAMLEISCFSRVGGIERLGSRQFLKDWTPQNNTEVLAYYREALRRLTNMAESEYTNLGDRAREILSKRTSDLLHYCDLFDDLYESLLQITKKHGLWPEVIYAINSWLYYYGEKGPDGYINKVRQLSKMLMPSDLIGQTIFFTKNYQIEIHNPDQLYSEENIYEDFEYANRQSISLAQEISKNFELSIAVTKRLLETDIKNPYVFMSELGRNTLKAESIFAEICIYIEQLGRPINQQALSGFMAGLSKQNSELANKCLTSALKSPTLKSCAIALLKSVKHELRNIQTILELIESGDISPEDCRFLAYGRGLDHFSEKEILEFVHHLEKYGEEGLSSSIEIINLYLHGGKIEGEALACHIKELLIKKSLYSLEKVTPYEISSLFTHVERAGFCDGDYAKQLTQCFLYEPNSFLLQIYDKFAGVKYEIFQNLIKNYASTVWSEIKDAYANPKKRVWLKCLFSVQDNISVSRESVLMQLPKELYINWIYEVDIEERLSFILSWVNPIVKKDSCFFWHPLVLEVLNNPCITTNTLDSLLQRVKPRSWVGSIIPHLKKYIPLIKELNKHPNPIVSVWAHSSMEKINKEISIWRKREEEERL